MAQSHLSPGTRVFADHFVQAVPCTWTRVIYAGCYLGLLHYLRTVATMGPEAAHADGAAVVAAMKAMPMDDPLFGRGRIRADGRKTHDMHLFRIEPAAASDDPWDLVHTTPGGQGFRPMAGGGCPLA